MPHGKQSKKNASGAGTIRKKTVRRGGREYTYWEARYTVGFDPGIGRQKQRSRWNWTAAPIRSRAK